MTTPRFPNTPVCPSGRPSDPVAKPLTSAQARTAPTPKSAAEKLAADTARNSRRAYVTTARLMALSSSLTGRDWAILATLNKLRLASSGQLERLCFVGVSQRRARQSLASLADRGVIARLPRVVGGVRSGSSGYVYTLDVAGSRLVRPQHRFRRSDDPGQRFLAHGLAVSELYTRLVEADRAGRLDLRDFVAEPASWRAFAGPGGGRATLKPDAFVVVRLEQGRYEDRWLVEVDLATEGASVVARKCEQYRRYWQSGTEQARTGVFPRVLWLVPDVKRYATVIDVFGRQPEVAWPLFRVALFDGAVTRIAQGAGV
jgi:hypothetical protein